MPVVCVRCGQSQHRGRDGKFTACEYRPGGKKTEELKGFKQDDDSIGENKPKIEETTPIPPQCGVYHPEEGSNGRSEVKLKQEQITPIPEAMSETLTVFIKRGYIILMITGLLGALILFNICVYDAIASYFFRI